MLKRTAAFLLFWLIWALPMMASHYMGGEITWQCLQNGKFRFIMKLYRECGGGINYGTTETLTVTGCPAISSIQMNLYPNGNPRDADDGSADGRTDISPDCWNPSAEINCVGASLPNSGAIEEWYFTSDAAFPGGVLISGVPPSTGWIFSHTGCCRNPSANMVNPTSANWFLRAIMYPYNGANTNPCYDSSPVFAEVPSTVICTGYPFKYNHNASDPELDSLDFGWAPALQAAGVNMGYQATYSYNSPLPGTAQNPANVPATMNPYTGEISYTSYTSGAFVTVTKVTAYRCGIKIAEIFREMQIILLQCPGSNTPPDIPGAFYNPITGLYDIYVDTVYAGEVVDFDINSLDLGVLPNTNPQTITLEASGQDFGAGFSNPNAGCLRPPCATLNPAPPISAMVALATHFHWQTSCDHLTKPFPTGSGTTSGCATLYNIHNFIIKVFDDYCPAPGIRIATISIVVLPKPVLKAPDLRCLAVDTSGGVTLTWIIPPDPQLSFDSYHIFRSSSPGGPYTEIDSIFTYSQTSYYDAGAGANTAPRYYYLQSRSGCGGLWFSSPGDTMASMFLNVTATGGGQIADLTWNPIHTPLPQTSHGVYEIHREFPAGIWTTIKTTTATSYLDTVNICSAYVNYRIEVQDSSGCISISSVDGEYLHDGTPPALPILDTVSVDIPSGKTVLGWEASTSPDTRKYYIFQQIGGPWQLIDSVFGISNTTYTNPNSNPLAASETYCIAAVDSCDKLSPMGQIHSTIFLQPPSLNACADRIALSWSPYINMDPALKGYRIFMSENGSPFSLMGTTDSLTTYFEHHGFTENSNYCYYIQAYNAANTRTSTSNVQCVLATKPNQPQFVFLRYATVVKNQDARIGFFVDSTAYITKFKILRSEDGINFDTIDVIYPTTNKANVSYTDVNAEVRKMSYFYKVVVVDSCNIDLLTSNTGRTIYLDGTVQSYLVNYLFWNIYEDRYASAYNVFREVEDYEDYRSLASLVWNETNYTDDVYNYTDSKGRFKYMIQAQLYDLYLGRYPFSDTVLSNELLLLQEPRLYVPTAFVPDGNNNIFKPIGVFTDSEDYYFTVYNRWGQKIFETTDTQEGWDGKFNGSKAPLSVYAYYVRIKDAAGKYIEKNGTVTLIR